MHRQLGTEFYSRIDIAQSGDVKPSCFLEGRRKHSLQSVRVCLTVLVYETGSHGDNEGQELDGYMVLSAFFRDQYR